MVRANPSFLNLKSSYLFVEIANRVKAFHTAHPNTKIIRMGIGDVTEPLPPACREAMKAAVDEMGERASFKGYGPSEGYAFLREAIAAHDYQARGCEIAADEIFVSDGSKQDSANIAEIFAAEAKVAVSDPVYPVYVDSNVMAGRSGAPTEKRYENFVYLEARPDNGYVPALPSEPVDLIYLCYPNNPTGTVATRAQLEAWVGYAREHGAVIFYDAAYEAFIQDPAIPHSIYEIAGARECAIEMRSFSKNAGFTGTRCAYAVVPKDLQLAGPDGPVSAHQLWNRRQSTKFNGVSYPVQKAAAAVYSEAGQAQVKELVGFYMENARLIREAFLARGLQVVGGDNAPYVWINVPGKSSWDFFDRLLQDAGIVCTPGAGFGVCGEGHIRLSAFNSRDNVLEAIERLKTVQF
ncbi:MAG: LL-diaminopimelate aminotransferase [Opitutales bacterium]